MKGLNAEAKSVLRDAGWTQAGWARHHFGPDATVWYGDKCGCPDDRCMDGHHHEPAEDCDCLRALIEMEHETSTATR